MGLTVDHIEIRYRPSDSAAAWTFVTVPAGQGSIQLKGVERGRSYQIEARSVAPSGAASAWVAQTHVVADATILPLAPTGLSATPVADGVALKWAVASTQRPDAEYEVWRTTDLAGAPDPAGWTQIQVVTALAWTDPITDGVLRWYRVRSHDFSGHTSAYSSNINSRGKTVADGADVSKNNVPLTLFNPKFEGGNVGWTSSSLFTIEQNGNAFEGAWCAVFRGNGTVNSDALRNTVLNPVVPGQMVMVRGMIKGAAGDGFARARISWRDASNVEFAVSTAPVQLSGTFGWTLSKVISAAPAGAAIAVMEWEVINCSTGTYYVDAGYLDYLSSDLSEVPDAAASLRYAVRDIDTNRRAVVDFTQGHLSKNLDNIADTTTFVRPFTRSAEPMVGNPTFEQGGGSPTGSDSGWRADIGNSADMTYETSSPILGSRSLKLHGTVGNYTQMSNLIHFTAKPGDTIYVEAAGKVSAAGVKGRIGIQFSLASGGGSGQGSTTFTGTTAVTQSAQAVAGAGTVEGFLFVMYDATSTAAGDALFDSILVSRVRNIDNELADGTTYFRAGTQAQDNIIHVGTCPSGGGNQFSYRQFSTQSYTIASGDKLHFDVFIDHRSPEFKYSIDFSYGASSFFRGTGTKDQNGLDGHPSTDLSAWATGRWYHRVFDLSALAGNAISSWASAFEGDTAGLYTGRLANIKIVNGSTLKAVIFSAGALGSTPIFFSAETYTGVSLTTAHLSAGAASLDYHVADGSTYGRALLARLSAGKPLIDFSETIHIAKHLGNIPDDSGSARFAVLAIDGNRRGIVDLSQGHLNKNLDNVADTGTYKRVGASWVDGSARVLLDFSLGAHLNKHLGYIADDSGSARFAVLAIDGNRRGIVDLSQGHLNKNLDNVADTSGRWASPQAGASGDGFQILSNPDFAGGLLTGYGVYDNNATGRVTLTAESDWAAPNSSGWRMKVAVTAGGGISPGSGGFTRNFGPDSGAFQVNTYHRGSTILFRVRANIPVGWAIAWASNQTGTGSTFTWLTSTAGTGDWFEYVIKLVIGSTGTFSTTGFFYIDNGSNTAAVTWYVAMCSAVCTSLPAGFGLWDIDSSRRPLTDFGSSHYNKHLGNVADDSGSSRYSVLAIDGSRRAITDWSQSHLNKNADNFADGSTYGRPLLARLNSGKPWIDFSEAIHSGKHLGNVPDDGANRCAWGTSAQKNAAVDSSGNLLLKNKVQAVGSTVEPTTSSNTFADLAEMTLTVTTSGNKVFILFNGVFLNGTGGESGVQLRLLKDGSAIGQPVQADWGSFAGGVPWMIALPLIYIDTPSAASHTYKIQWLSSKSNQIRASDVWRFLEVVELG